MVALDDVLETIASGELDDDIGDIAQAVRGRFEARGTWWKIDFDGLVITEDDITIDEAQQIEAAAKLPLRVIDPANTVTQAAAIVMVALRTRRGMSLDNAAKYLQKVNSLELVKACSRFVKAGDDDPKDGSSGADETPPVSTASPAISP